RSSDRTAGGHRGGLLSHGAFVRRGRRAALVLELADGPGTARQRATAAPAVGRHEAEQEDDRLAGDEQQDDDSEQEGRADPARPLPDDGQRRDDDEERQDDELKAEAAEPGAFVRIEVRALVLNGSLVRRHERRWYRRAAGGAEWQIPGEPLGLGRRLPTPRWAETKRWSDLERRAESHPSSAGPPISDSDLGGSGEKPERVLAAFDFGRSTRAATSARRAPCAKADPGAGTTRR